MQFDLPAFVVFRRGGISHWQHHLDTFNPTIVDDEILTQFGTKSVDEDGWIPGRLLELGEWFQINGEVINSQ
jgi:hypothetical protein